MLSCTCRYFTLFSRSFPSRGPDFNLFHAAQVSTPLTPCLHFSLSPTCTADTHPVRRQGCAAAPTSATRTGTRPLPCRRGRGRAHARRGSVYLPAPAARSPLAPLCSLTRSLARPPLHLAFHAAQPQRVCEERGEAREATEREVAALLLAAE